MVENLEDRFVCEGVDGHAGSSLAQLTLRLIEKCQKMENIIFNLAEALPVSIREEVKTLLQAHAFEGSVNKLCSRVLDEVTNYEAQTDDNMKTVSDAGAQTKIFAHHHLGDARYGSNGFRVRFAGARDETSSAMGADEADAALDDSSGLFTW
eukprot:GHVU01037225.1.p3 GENE.GHVU01037225.1~~GHVU01037225.1.p3  ORF type:complete len:152 (-),score=18.28 GHVU01037225.1:673-1128(-)